MSEYLVEGYGAAARNPEYDGPYLDGYNHDPAVAFAFAGDPEKQAQLQKVLDETDGAPVLTNGVVTIQTPKGEPNVVVLTKEPDEVRNVVLDETEVDRINREREEAELSPSDSDDEDKVDLTGPGGEADNREGKSYNGTEKNDKYKGITLS